MAIDDIQKQVGDLSIKVDSLHSLVEELLDKVSNIPLAPDSSADMLGNTTKHVINATPLVGSSMSDLAIDHKDILLDDRSSDGDKTGVTANISPEIQVQRLTAQLTAAYNRMAVLEEQILACRFH